MAHIPPLSLPVLPSHHTKSHYCKQRGGVVYDRPTANQLSDTNLRRHRCGGHAGAVATKRSGEGADRDPPTTSRLQYQKASVIQKNKTTYVCFVL